MHERFNKIILAWSLLGIAVFSSCGSGLDVLLDSPLQKMVPLFSNGYQALLNNSPVINDFSANMTNPHPGQSVTLTVTASDAEGDTLSYAYAFTAGSGTLSASGASATASVDTMIASTVTVTVTDGKGGQATRTLDLSGSNEAPAISSFSAAAGNIFNTGSDTKNLAVDATDGDGDTLTYSYSVVSGLGSASGSTATGTFTSGTIAGYSTVRVTVSDPYGGVATSNVQIKVCGWRQLASLGDPPPTARDSHSAILDGSGNMIIFGGVFGSGEDYKDDVRRYNIASQTWTNITPLSGPTPAARKWHRAVYDSAGNNMYITAGFNGTFRNDTWAFNLTTGTWNGLLPSSSPPGRILFSAINDGGGDMIIYGGYQSDTWRYTIATNAWTQVFPPSGPGEVTGHSTIFDGVNMIIFGGQDSVHIFRNEIWRYTIATEQWMQLTTPDPPPAGPAARWGNSAVYDGVGKMIIYGGNFSGGYNNDVWAYDIAGQTWEDYASVNGPAGRYYHSAIYYSGSMIIYGGALSGLDGGTDLVVWEYILP